jgi:hypothetical protein
MNNLLYGSVKENNYNLDLQQRLLELKTLLDNQKDSSNIAPINEIVNQTSSTNTLTVNQQLINFFVDYYLDQFKQLLAISTKAVDQDCKQFKLFLEKTITEQFLIDKDNDYNYLTLFYKQSKPGSVCQLLIASKLQFETIYNAKDNRLSSVFAENRFFNREHIKAINNSFISNSKLIRLIETGIIRHLISVREKRLKEIIRQLDIDNHLSLRFVVNNQKIHCRKENKGKQLGLNKNTYCGLSTDKLEPAVRGLWQESEDKKRCSICRKQLKNRSSFIFNEDAYNLDELDLLTTSEKEFILASLLTTKKIKTNNLTSNVYPLPEKRSSINDVDYTLLVTGKADNIFADKLAEIFLLNQSNKKTKDPISKLNIQEIYLLSKQIIADDVKEKFAIPIKELNNYLNQ